MSNARSMHPDFFQLLNFKDKPLIDLFTDLRNYVFEICPDCNELVYHTHALTAVFSLSDKLADAFCTVPVYSNHFNLAFNRGTLLKDPHRLLTGTGKLMRHIAVENKKDYRNQRVRELIREAVLFSKKDMDKPISKTGMTISKISR
ncbi:MAG: hypothetical protein DI535_14555 [Citrobacter freundii]|nr:MAG: hypothetical protein DI535_14555 [Citrobacter freundii]